MACILEGKPMIVYPLFWDYKLILYANEDAKALCKELLLKEKYELKEGKDSKNKKYKSYFLSIFVENEAHRLELFKLLKEHSKFLL